MTSQITLTDYTKPTCDKSGACVCTKGYAFDADTKYCAGTVHWCPSNDRARTHTDVNECLAVPPVCSQRCMNTEGSFRCMCNTDYYTLAVDKVTCVPNAQTTSTRNGKAGTNNGGKSCRMCS